ncbi:CRAL-TRIO domain-containing protein [Chytriomyces sp. MP71]|nr:CRAL-TRIO domain-containing protein [Chytriomyces sp. MP71]
MDETRASAISLNQAGRASAAGRASIASLGSITAGISNSWLQLNGELALTEGKLSELRSVEKKYLETARELYRAEKVDCFNDFELLKFLKANKHHTGKALGALSDTLSWRESFKVPGILDEDFKDLDDSGVAQFMGRTRNGVPILVIINSRHVSPKDAVSREKAVRYGIYLIERARSEGILTDRLAVILDRFNTTTSQMDTTTFKALIPILQKNYPETLAKFIIFPNSTMFWMAWKLLKGAIDSSTLKKIEVRDNPDTLIGIIDREFLLERYGGLVKDMYDDVPVDPHTREPTNEPVAQQPEVAVPSNEFNTDVNNEPAVPSAWPAPTSAGTTENSEEPAADTANTAAIENIPANISSDAVSASKKGFKFNWKGWGTTSTSPTKPNGDTPPVSPDKVLPPAAALMSHASTQHKSMAVPPLCPLVVEVLWSAPDFDVEFPTTDKSKSGMERNDCSIPQQAV